MLEYEAALLPDLLPSYYKKIFPHNLFYRWLSYGGDNKSYYQNREFSFTLKDDVYIRYLSFSDQVDFEKELVRFCPYKIDIGAVFSHKPKEQKSIKPGAFKALEKELVFDVDVTDYDDVRFCCSGADICQKCWPLMAMAVQVVDRALRDDFGFERVLWVFSGRRGVHGWVVDEAARSLSYQARASIVDYLTLVKGGDNQLKKCYLNAYKLHPFISNSIQLIDQHFEEYVINKQDFLSNPQRLQNILNLIPDQLRTRVCDFIKGQEADDLTSSNQWEVIKRLTDVKKEELSKMQQDKKPVKDLKEQVRQHKHLIEEIKLQYCYPRLDANVSIGVNHLLKSPFSVHPKTGKVCVPFEACNAFNFDLSTVPTISQLLTEYKDLTQDKSSTDKNDLVCASLEESIRVFKEFVLAVETDALRKKKTELDKTLEF